MNMRDLIKITEDAMGWAPSAKPEAAEQPADRFIHSAQSSIQTTFGDLPHIQFRKISPDSVAVVDDMQGTRTARSWAILRSLKLLADKYGVRMNIQGASGPRFR